MKSCLTEAQHSMKAKEIGYWYEYDRADILGRIIPNLTAIKLTMVLE